MKRSGIRKRPRGRSHGGWQGWMAGVDGRGGWQGGMFRLTAVPDSAKLHPGYESVEASAILLYFTQPKLTLQKAVKFYRAKNTYC